MEAGDIMSDIRHKKITTITDIATLTRQQMGEIVANKGIPFTISVPTAAASAKGLWYYFTNIGVGTLTVDEVAGGDLVILNQLRSALLICDGTAWRRIDIDPHVDDNVTDPTGVHDFITDTPGAPEDEKYLQWDNGNTKHIYADGPGGYLMNFLLMGG